MFNATLRFGIFCLAIGCSLLVKAQGADVSELRAYGPGGPLEPIRECARAFSNQEGVQVTVTGGPEEQWIAQARKDADVVFGGADYMLTQLTLKYPDLINPLTRTELYTRGAVILVRKGNPKNIAEFKDSDFSTAPHRLLGLRSSFLIAMKPCLRKMRFMTEKDTLE
jgi:accessory colonization factor AcfC